MKVITLIVIAMLSGCGAHFDWAALAVSEASLACDWAQTRSAASQDWKGHAEANPFLGRNPSTTQVDMYFGVSALLNLTLWAALPKGWRSIVPIGITAMETSPIRNNISTTHTVCGIKN